MPKRLSITQQRKLLNALPAYRKEAFIKHVKEKHMKGEGIMDILKSAWQFLGPIAKEVGPTLLKEIALPFLQKKLNGEGKRRKRGKGLNP